MVDRISSTPPPIYPQGPQGLGPADPAEALATRISQGLEDLAQFMRTGDLEQIAQTVKTLHTLSEEALRC